MYTFKKYWDNVLLDIPLANNILPYEVKKARY